MSRALGLLLCGCAGMGAAQEPIFVTPPVTMYQFGAVFGLDVEGGGGTLAVTSEAALGLLPPWTVSLHAVGIDDPGASFELARLHAGTRVRLVKIDRPREWVLLSVYSAVALPAGDEARRVAESHGVPDAVFGLSGARMARDGDSFVDVSVAHVPTPAGSRTVGTFGLAWGWRPRPGGYGELEGQLFGEARLQYADRGAAVLGLAPGFLVHSKNKVFKLGVLFPVWEREAEADPVIRAAVKLLY
jgi:hypothetical protein